MKFYFLKAIGKNLNGLCQSGAWGCFDEFNRIDASVLSVISSQLKTIQQSLMAKLKRFLFEGTEIDLDSRVGIFYYNESWLCWTNRITRIN